ncbi:hypothetical protein TruAng_003638 [Truncatella angustata]|nr:hypothetical protein TruAng_003638 [Truncatella angustata]
MDSERWSSGTPPPGVADPFGDHAVRRSISSNSTSEQSNRTLRGPQTISPKQHGHVQQSDASPVLEQSKNSSNKGNTTPSEGLFRDFPAVASSSRQLLDGHEGSSRDKPRESSKRSSRQSATSGKGKAPERILQASSQMPAPAIAVTRSFTSSQEITNVKQSGPPTLGAPPLLLNEKTAAEAVEALEPKIIKRGQRKVFWQKQFLTALVFSANFILIFASWWWQKYYYIYLPFISLPLVLNCIMVFMIITYSIKNLVFKPEQIVPATPETMVLVMPCYNETFEECTRSLDSLISQVRIDQHKKAIMIICDGKVRGPGMEKTTAQYLIEDILMGHGTERRSIRAAYRAWDGQTMDIEYVKGIYKGVPFFCIIKQQNQGKRDSLIVSRSFVYNFNRRAERPKVVFAPVFFEAMANWLHNEAEFDMVDVIIGMDADTVFDRDCISHLVTESHYPNTVGVCGYVAVDFLYGNWNLWSIYQSAEYTISQALRRLHQSLVTHKVSCLPGCCQLLKVCEETCGDRVLIDLFGYHPKPLDGIIRRIRATASEDRNHVCLMLMESPRAQTRQALRARAYTDVPHGFRVFLSQRRRWTLGATSNDLMLFTKAHLWHFNWWERIVAFSNVITWLLNPFVIASLGCMIYAFIHIPWWIIVTFASIMIIPLLYYVTMIAWMPRNLLERCQFMLGLCIFTLCGPFINIGVTVYAIWNMDNFSWGKTRTVVAVTGEVEEASADEEHWRMEDAVSNNENDVGPQVPDEENQLSARAATSYIAMLHRPLASAPRKVQADAPEFAARAASPTPVPPPGLDGDNRVDSSHNGISGNGHDSFQYRPLRAARPHSIAVAQGCSRPPFESGPFEINRGRYRNHSPRFRPEDFRTRH